MSLESWLNAGWLRVHPVNADEIRDLWGVLDEDIVAAEAEGVLPEVRFELACNAAHKLCIILLYAEGFRPGRGQPVLERFVRAMPLILGPAREVDADFLDTCRRRRDALGAEGSAPVDPANADALLQFARELRGEVLAWLRGKHPDLAPE